MSSLEATDDVSMLSGLRHHDLWFADQQRRFAHFWPFGVWTVSRMAWYEVVRGHFPSRKQLSVIRAGGVVVGREGRAAERLRAN